MKHPGDGLSARFGRGEVVDSGDSPPLVVGRVGEAGGALDAGVVDQDVDRPGFVLDPLEKGGGLRGVREVGGVGGAPERGRERLEGVLGPRDERHSGPGAGEGVGEGLADASRRPGDQDSLPR
jgi:hypothetical protein